jgi:diguanylate cyclase (GGDEF)-like protein
MRDITERKRLQDELQQFASFDEMTGAINRRHFMFLARIEHRRAVRLQQELSMALIDLDYLKPINDLHGHAVGDMVLQRLVQVYQKNIREIDIFARLGGDEFVLLLPGASSEQAREVIDRARENLSEQPLLYEGRTVSITTSVGIASIMSDEDTFELLMSRADYAMYQAKQFGRNRIIIS